jgi:hypothetical protein
LNLNIKNIFYSRGEWGHVGHVPGATSSITDGGDEEKKYCEMNNFITTTGYKFK